MEEIEFFTIHKHPLKNNYMCSTDCPYISLSPFFGSLRQCENKKKYINNIANKEFSLLDEKLKSEIISYINNKYII